MSITRIYYWIRRIYRLLLMLAATFGVGPLAKPPAPAPSVPPPPPAQIQPAPPVPLTPAGPVHVNIQSCATGGPNTRSDGTKGYIATCVVNGTTFTVPPGDFPSRAAAQAAIAHFRSINPPIS